MKINLRYYLGKCLDNSKKVRNFGLITLFSLGLIKNKATFEGYLILISYSLFLTISGKSSFISFDHQSAQQCPSSLSSNNSILECI